MSKNYVRGCRWRSVRVGGDLDMKEKFVDYSIEDLEIVEEIETESESENVLKSKSYRDYDESDLIESALILEDVFNALLNKNWQVLGRTDDKIIISEVSEHQIEDLDQIEILSIESEYFFDVIDRQNRFTSESISKKVGKVRNSKDYYFLAEEVKVENLKLKLKGNK